MIADKGLFVTKSFVLQLRKKITSVLIKETAYYCLHVLKLNQACINIDFIKHIFESYRKGVDYMSQNLDIIVERIMNIFCRCLSDSVFKKFKIEVDVFVFKKKKTSPYCFQKTFDFLLFFSRTNKCY